MPVLAVLISEAFNKNLLCIEVFSCVFIAFQKKIFRKSMGKELKGVMRIARWLVHRERSSFFLLLVSKMLSESVDWIHYLALIFYVNDLTGSILATGTVLAFGSIPSLLMSPVGSVLAAEYGSVANRLAFGDALKHVHGDAPRLCRGAS